MVDAAVAAIWFAMRPSAARACGAVVTEIVAFSADFAGSCTALPPETAAAEKSFGIRTTAW